MRTEVIGALRPGAVLTEGIAFSFIAYATPMLAVGCGREVRALLYLFAVRFAVRYAYLQT
ncbi:MAG: hypothetical protein ACE5I7_01855 [Candidatus Binatia bacterium]